MRNFCRRPDNIHLLYATKQKICRKFELVVAFEKILFKLQLMRSKYCQWCPCYLSDQDYMRTSQALLVLDCNLFGLSEENICSLRQCVMLDQDKNAKFFLENLTYIICTNQSNENHISHFLSIASDPMYHTVNMAIAKI